MHELVPSAALAGAVELDGVDIYGPTLPVTQTRLRIGMVFQRPNPFPSMTIAQNVLSGLRLSGTKVPNPDALVRECSRTSRSVEGDSQPAQRVRRRALRRSAPDGSASPDLSPYDPGFFSWTSRAPPWTRYRPA